MTNLLDEAVADAMREAARRAILPRFTPGRPFAREYKAAGEAVTAADHESEAILTERLGRLVPGARIGGKAFTTSAAMPDRPVVAATRLFADAAMRAALIAELGKANEVMDCPRCAAAVYPDLAVGTIDAALFTRTLAWDHAACAVFLKEAGGMVLRPDGSAYRCDEPDAGLLAATCPEQWERIHAQLEASGIALSGAHRAAAV